MSCLFWCSTVSLWYDNNNNKDFISVAHTVTKCFTWAIKRTSIQTNTNTHWRQEDLWENCRVTNLLFKTDLRLSGPDGPTDTVPMFWCHHKSRIPSGLWAGNWWKVLITRPREQGLWSSTCWLLNRQNQDWGKDQLSAADSLSCSW